MAIAYDNATSDSRQSSSFSYNHTVNDNTNGILVVIFSNYDGSLSNRSVSSVSYNTVALTKLRADEITGAGGQRTEIWYLLAPATGTHAVAITTGGGSPYVDSCAISFTGADSSQPDSQGTNTGSSITSLTTNITTSTDGVMLVDVCELASNNASPGASQTQVLDESGGTSNGSYKLVGAAGSQSMSWTFSSDTAVMSVMGIKAYVAAGTTVKDIIGMGIIPYAR